MVTLSKLILNNLNLSPPEGDLAGTCVFCGAGSRRGFRADFPNSFTSFNRVYDGNIICEYCYYIFKHPEFRRRSWLVTLTSFRFLNNKEEILNTLLNPPNEDWIMYITKSRRKHGWLNLTEKLNSSRDMFIVGYDEDIVWIDREVFEKIISVVQLLRGYRVPKQMIFLGELSPNVLKRIRDKDYWVINFLHNFSRSTLLDLALFLVR